LWIRWAWKFIWKTGKTLQERQRILTDNEKFSAWLEYAERDLDAAGAMFDTGRWFYVVFMCQQAIEKLVKGLYILYVDENVPRIHNIKTLVERFEDRLNSSIPDNYYSLFKLLSAYYVSNRYPDFISKVGEQVSKDEATGIFIETKEVFTWLLTLKPQDE